MHRHTFLSLACLVTILGGIGLVAQQSESRVPNLAKLDVKIAPVNSNKELQLVVTSADAAVTKNLSGLPISISDSTGKVIANSKLTVDGDSQIASAKVAVSAKEVSEGKITLGSGEQTRTIPMHEVLLAKGHETTLVLSKSLISGSKTPFRCSVHGVKSARETMPYDNAQVSIQMKDKDGKERVLWQGKTNEKGTVETELTIPEIADGNYTFAVVSSSPFGQERLEQSVQIQADSKILLVTDKPMYQPGQTMHLRALALRPFDLRPIGNNDIVFEIEDPKGNKVFKRSLKTTDYGIASIDFELASEVNMGAYQIRALIGKQQAEKTVAVKRYVLPKFKVNVTADKKFYLPKETIKAELQTDYFFGKPVSGGKVKVTASTFDVEFRQFKEWEGKTDAKGHVKFEIPLPDYFVGQPIQKGNALVKLDVEVIDTADHREKITKTYTVSEQPIQVSLIPEGGKLVPGIKNRVFAATVYPDGSPAQTSASIWVGNKAEGEPIAKVKTNAAGLAEFEMIPDAKQFRQGNWEQQKVEILGGNQIIQMPKILLDMTVSAHDEKKNSATKTVELNSHPAGENVLLRLDKAVYDTSDAMKIDIRSSSDLPTVYLDVVRGGQVVVSKWFDIKNGRAEYGMELPQSIFGSLEVHAYQVLRTGEIIRDSRVVYVQPKNDLQVTVKSNQETFAPGQNGRIQFQVTDKNGKGTAAALGVIIVDEAVYALQDMQPGLEKVYFTLQKELLTPSAQVLEFKPNVELPQIIRQPAIPNNQQQVAQVLLTAVKVQPPARWQVDPTLARRNQFEAQVDAIGWGLYQYAWQKDDALTLNEKSSRWEFSDNLLEKMTKSGYIYPQMQRGPLGEELSIPSLSREESGFSSQNLAAAITYHRQKRLAETITSYLAKNKEKFFENGRWNLSDFMLLQAARSENVDDRYLCDAWGQGFKLVPKNASGVKDEVFSAHDLVSAGPDRDYRTADDISWLASKDLANVGGWWHNDQLAMAQRLKTYTATRELQRNRFFDRQRRQNGLFEREELRDGFAKGRGGFGGGPGGFPVPNRPMAPGAMPFDRADAKNEAAAGPAPEPTAGGESGGSAAKPAPRVREYFPETMLWQPALITDDSGVANLSVSFADSITTWRLTASASSLVGSLGSTTMPLKVFQDFFVDIDMPVALTQNDEIAFPIAVYNYLKEPQTVTLELEKGDWFTLVDDHGFKRTLTLQPNEVTAVHFRVKAHQVGSHPLTVKAFGSKKSDAVRRIIDVEPDGKKIETTFNDRLSGSVKQTITIPENAVPDASKVIVRVYPGVMAQIVEGLEGMMRMPNGCFEQTSSSAYPNILIVDYIKKNRLANAEMLLKAENYLNLGYQRLLTFERPGGGFDWWGSGEPLVWLSAYGLQEFSDMSRVYPIDRGIIDRTQQFLLRKMDQKEGTWADIGATHSESIERMGNPKLLLTSYVTWSLLESGLPKNQLTKSVDYIRNNINLAGDNAYILALAANALAAYDAKDDSTLEVIRKLETLRKVMPEWEACCYPAGKVQTLTYARGNYVDVETTALSVLAMVKTGEFSNSVNKALTFLVKSKEGNGTWGSTSATILSLKAMIAASSTPEIKEAIPFTILMNGKEIAHSQVTNENSDVMQLFDLEKHTKVGANEVQIRVKGETPFMYQIVGRHYEQWDKETKPKSPEFSINVTYDRTKLSTNDLLKAKATVTYNGKYPANMVMVDLGIAPGFTVDAGDFAELVDQKKIQKFSLTSRQIILYLNGMRPEETVSFEYSMRAKYPLRAQTPSSSVYEYYTPNNRATASPATLTVVEEK